MELIGKTISHYKVLEELGEGGMALVFKAHDMRLDRSVALKVIQTKLQSTQKFFKRFEREARALAKFSHPNIVRILDYGEYEEMPYLVMEYVSGGTLKQRMAGNCMTWDEAADLLAPIARALDYAHTHKIVHRDVKPTNIMLQDTGGAVLMDFGIAKLLEAEDSVELTGTGVGIGTPAYMAPEQGLGKQIDGRADIYALCVVFYELVAGAKPHQAETPMAVLHKQLTEPPAPLRQFISEIPDEVEMLVQKALATEPEDRHASAGEFALALEELGEGARQRRRVAERQRIEHAEPGPIPEPAAQQKSERTPTPVSEGETQIGVPDVLEPEKMKPRWRRWLWAGMGAIALAAAALFIFGGDSQSRTSVQPVDQTTTAGALAAAVLQATQDALPAASPTQAAATSSPTVFHTATETPLPSATALPTITPFHLPDSAISIDNAARVSELSQRKVGLMMKPSLALSGDGRLLAFAIDTTTSLYDARTLELVAQYEIIIGTSGGTSLAAGPHVVALSPDGERLAVAYRNLAIHDARDGIELSDIGIPMSGTMVIRQMSFSADWGRVFINDNQDNAASALYRVADGALLAGGTDLGNYASAGALSPDGKTLATGSEEGYLILWPVVDIGNPRQIIPQDDYVEISGITFSADSQNLLWGTDGGHLWLLRDLESSYPEKLIGHAEVFWVDGKGSRISSVAFHPDGALFASGSYDNTVRLWSTKSGAPLTVLDGHSGYIGGLAFSPDGQLLYSYDSGGLLHVWGVRP